MATDLLEHDEAVVAVLRETMERAARIGACDPGLIPEILALIRAAQKKARETLDPTREGRYSQARPQSRGGRPWTTQRRTS